jgi:hypothetical protein
VYAWKADASNQLSSEIFLASKVRLAKAQEIEQYTFMQHIVKRFPHRKGGLIIIEACKNTINQGLNPFIKM